MATVSQWNPFGVSLNITATPGTVTRISATQYTVVINASWKVYWSGNQTNYGMTAASGGKTQTISAFNGTKRSSGSASFTGTYTISGNSSATKTVTVTFRNFNTDNGHSATKNVSFSVSVPAWTSYKVSYNANGGSGVPSAQTKWRDQTLTLSSTKPTRTGYTFSKWNTNSGGTGTSYSAGGSYTANAAATLYAQWTANTYRIVYDANGGTLGSVTSQTKTYGVNLALTGTATRTNYNFLGWSTSKTATTPTYTTGATYSANAATTLYAVWELAYTKPRITNLSITRCTRSGTPSEEGTSARIGFEWAADLTGARVTVSLKQPTSTSWTIFSDTTYSDTTSGGSMAMLHDIPTDITCDVRIVVEDARGSTTKNAVIPGISFPIDVLAGSPSGVAFGGPASLADTADVYYDINARKNLTFQNNQTVIKGTRNDGTVTEVFNPQDSNNNVVVGYGNYADKVGDSYLYGHDVYLGVSNTATSTRFRPYRRAGDSTNIIFRGTGYCTNSSKDVTFWLPSSIPILTGTTVTVENVNGFVLRQGNKYTHGSASNTYVFPTLSVVTTYLYNGIVIKASFDDVTNATNNDAIGIYWSGRLVFS